jgi:hypothetical protein
LLYVRFCYQLLQYVWFLIPRAFIVFPICISPCVCERERALTSTNPYNYKIKCWLLIITRL